MSTTKRQDATRRQIRNLVHGLPAVLLPNPFTELKPRYHPRTNAAKNVLNLCRESRLFNSPKHYRSALEERLVQVAVQLMAASREYRKRYGKRPSRFTYRTPLVLADIAVELGIDVCELEERCAPEVERLEKQALQCTQRNA